jgi:hypothetical protein
VRAVAFRRRIDPTCYRFVHTGEREGYPAWKRVDLDLWVVRRADVGWVVVDAAGAILGRPSHVLPAAQGDLPPEGDWVSKKGDRSYVYDLVFA